MKLNKITSMGIREGALTESCSTLLNFPGLGFGILIEARSNSWVSAQGQILHTDYLLFSL